MRGLSRPFVLALATILAATPAHALGPGSSKESGNKIRAQFELPQDGASAAGSVGEAGPRAVDIPTLAVPVFENGRLLNYLFISVRLQLVEGVDAWKLRDKAHYIRDGMIREAHDASVGRRDDPTRLDEVKAREVLLRGAGRVVDPAQILQIEFLAVDSQREVVF